MLTSINFKSTSKIDLVWFLRIVFGNLGLKEAKDKAEREYCIYSPSSDGASNYLVPAAGFDLTVAIKDQQRALEVLRDLANRLSLTHHKMTIEVVLLPTETTNVVIKGKAIATVYADFEV